MSERPGPQLPTPEWKRPFTFPYVGTDQNPLIIRVVPNPKGYRVFCDGLTLTETELAVLVYFSLGLSCRQIGSKIERTSRRVALALEQAKNRNNLPSKDELIAKAEALGILKPGFWGELEKAADRNYSPILRDLSLDDK